MVLSLLISHSESKNASGAVEFIAKRLDYLMGSRPTAVDLSNAIRHLKNTTSEHANTAKSATGESVRSLYIEGAEKILEDDYTTNLASE